MRQMLMVMAAPLLLAGGPAPATGASGSGALALAALVGEHAPLPAKVRTELARLLDGHAGHPYPAHSKIQVHADSVVCRDSDVDITLHTCELTFGKKKVSLRGRRAHELDATLAQIGVPPDGAAGSIYEALSHLVCTIDPQVIARKGGGGADCSFAPGSP